MQRLVSKPNWFTDLIEATYKRLQENTGRRSTAKSTTAIPTTFSHKAPVVYEASSEPEPEPEEDEDQDVDDDDDDESDGVQVQSEPEAGPEAEMEMEVDVEAFEDVVEQMSEDEDAGIISDESGNEQIGSREDVSGNLTLELDGIQLASRPESPALSVLGQAGGQDDVRRSGEPGSGVAGDGHGVEGAGQEANRSANSGVRVTDGGEGIDEAASRDGHAGNGNAGEVYTHAVQVHRARSMSVLSSSSDGSTHDGTCC